MNTDLALEYARNALLVDSDQNLRQFLLSLVRDDNLPNVIGDAVARQLFGEEAVRDGIVPDLGDSSPVHLVRIAIRTATYTRGFDMLSAGFTQHPGAAAALRFLVQYARIALPAVDLPDDDVVAACIAISQMR